MAYIKLNEEERVDFFMQYFNDLDTDEEFEGFDEFDIDFSACPLKAFGQFYIWLEVSFVCPVKIMKSCLT
jgi:hypothetical protein